MSGTLFDSIARIARHEARASLSAGVGKVVEVFAGDGEPKDYAVTVEMRDSQLVLPRVPVITSTLGFVAIPPIGALVLVVFLDGDANAPVMVGQLYHADLAPPEHTDGEIIVSLPPGEEPKIKIMVRPGAPSVRIELPGELVVELVEDRATVSVGGDSGMRLVLTGEGGGHAQLSAGKAELRIKKDGDITLSTTGNLKLEGNEIELSASSKVKITGPEVEIN